jgi:hypothetical protein
MANNDLTKSKEEVLSPAMHAGRIVLETKRTNVMKHFRYYSKQDILNITRLRRYETKLGELIKSVDHSSAIAAQVEASPAGFVLFGIPEDIGIRAYGTGGGYRRLSFQSLVNVQHRSVPIRDHASGHFDFDGTTDRTKCQERR